MSLTREQVRDVDRRAVEEFGVPGIILMENAGRGAAEVMIAEGVKGPAVVCAGRGNNGGDGFVIARHLANRGHEVRVLLFADPRQLAGDAAVNYRILRAAGKPIEVFVDESQRSGVPEARSLREADIDGELRGADWVVDALLGTGTKGEIREPYATVIECINRSGARVLAVDLPSGLDCDSGESLGPCVKAEHTATFVDRKAGFDQPGAEEWTGQVHVIDIGAPRAVLTES